MILILTPLESDLGTGTKKSCSVITSSRPVSNNSISNLLKTAAVVRNNSAYARLETLSAIFTQTSQWCTGSLLHPQTLPTTSSKIDKIFIESSIVLPVFDPALGAECGRVGEYLRVAENEVVAFANGRLFAFSEERGEEETLIGSHQREWSILCRRVSRQ